MIVCAYVCTSVCRDIYEVFMYLYGSVIYTLCVCAYRFYIAHYKSIKVFNRCSLLQSNIDDD